MGGLFGVASHNDCVTDLFFGVDYHSHLGTRRGGMAVRSEQGIERAIHNIENAPFRTKFERDVNEMKGNYGIGCISDSEPQPLIVRSHLGNYAIATVGRINNEQELVDLAFANGSSHFLEMSGGRINATELVASLINQKNSLVDGIRYAQEKIDGSMSLLLLAEEGIYAVRDRMGRTPMVLGQKDGACCASFESFAYLNLGYHDLRELGPGEIVLITPDNVTQLNPPRSKMKICAFLWTYYGYPTASYEGVNVEDMRYRCGRILARQDKDDPKVREIDSVAGVPDSGIAHAIGYANESGVPFSRPFIKYTPTWPRSFMPANQSMRNLVARMKILPVEALIKDKSLLFIDDSIVRGTQLGETAQFLYEHGAKEVHIRPACPPIVFGCKYLNFSRSTSPMDLITRRTIAKLEGTPNPDCIEEYLNWKTDRYAAMVNDIAAAQNFTTLKFQTLDGMLEAIGLDKSQVCTYCWTGRED